MRVVLWGPDYADLGRVGVSRAGDRAAIALTRGRHAKSYRHTDPNEDVAAAVAGDRATLLVCADGHNGATASVRAVEAVLDELGDDPPPELPGGADAWPDLFGRVNAAVLDAVAGSQQPSSRTVLVVALVSRGRLTFGALGDAALVVCRADAHRGRQVNREEMRFVGHPMSDRALRSLVSRGDVPLDPDEWVIAVTDGLSEFTRPMRPADVIPRILARAAATGDASPGTVARAIIDTAGEAGAGDNVAVALRAPEG